MTSLLAAFNDAERNLDAALAEYARESTRETRANIHNARTALCIVRRALDDGCVEADIETVRGALTGSVEESNARFDAMLVTLRDDYDSRSKDYVTAWNRRTGEIFHAERVADIKARRGYAASMWDLAVARAERRDIIGAGYAVQDAYGHTVAAMHHVCLGEDLAKHPLMATMVARIDRVMAISGPMREASTRSHIAYMRDEESTMMNR